MKKLFVILGLISILILTGCGNRPSKEELTLNYLNEIYESEGDTFTFINCGYDLFSGSNDRCYFNSTKYNGTVTVYLNKNEGKYYIYEDNYYQLFLYDDVQNYLNNIINQYAKVNIKFRFNLPYGSYKSLDEFLNGGNTGLDVYFISNTLLTENNIQSILNELANKKISGTFSFMKTNDKNLLSNYDLDYILKNQVELIEAKQNYYIDSKNFQIEKK